MNRIMRESKGIVRWFYVNMGLIVVMAAFLGDQFAVAQWEQLPDMPTARWALSTSVVDGKIYAIGGGASGYPASSLYRILKVYDPVTNTWVKKADMPREGMLFSASAVNGRIYVIVSGNSGEPSSTVQEYDPKTDTWTSKAPLPDGRWAMSSSVVNGKLYVIGGSNWNTSFPSMFEYDPLADTWTQRADMPAPRSALETCVVNGKIYAIRGRLNAITWGPTFPSVYAYDPLADTWTRKADMTTPREHFATTEVNGKIYAIAGVKENADMAGPNPYESTMEIYDPQTDTWAKEANLTTPRAYLRANSVDGKIYVIGGTTTWPPVVLSTVEVFDNTYITTSVSPQDKLSATWGRIKQRGVQ